MRMQARRHAATASVTSSRGGADMATRASSVSPRSAFATGGVIGRQVPPGYREHAEPVGGHRIVSAGYPLAQRLVQRHVPPEPPYGGATFQHRLRRSLDA